MWERDTAPWYRVEALERREIRVQVRTLRNWRRVVGGGRERQTGTGYHQNGVVKSRLIEVAEWLFWLVISAVQYCIVHDIFLVVPAG